MVSLVAKIYLARCGGGGLSGGRSITMADRVSIPRRKLGTQGLEVSAVGLGCAGLAGLFRADDVLPGDNAIHLIHHAFKMGVTLFDTADWYGPHTNEILLGKALKGLPRDIIQLSTKFGVFLAGSAMAVRGDPEYVRRACEDSLRRLDVEYIDLYYQHRVDKNTPIEATVGEMKKLVEEGKVKYIGLSDPSADTLRRGHAVHPITAVEIEWSLWSRDVEDEVVPVCRELGIGIVPYSPLGRGFFAGKASKEEMDENDKRRAMFPRFQAENLVKNRVLYDRVAALARVQGCTPGQLALAWLLNQGDDVVPIPGTTKIANLDENLGSLVVKLGAKEIEEVKAAVPKNDVAGERYNESTMKLSKFADTPPMESWNPQTNGSYPVPNGSEQSNWSASLRTT